MNEDIKTQICKLQECAIGEILTLAEIGLLPEQFRQFKKKVFTVLHEHLKPETVRLLDVLKQQSNSSK